MDCDNKIMKLDYFGFTAKKYLFGAHNTFNGIFMSTYMRNYLHWWTAAGLDLYMPELPQDIIIFVKYNICNLYMPELPKDIVIFVKYNICTMNTMDYL